MKRTDGIAPAPELIRAFFDAAIAAVRRLEEQPGFWYDRTLQVATGTGLKDVTIGETEGRFFYAAVLFETSRIAGEISYGDREFYVNTVVAQKRSGAYGFQYGLWEWANGLGRHDERAGGGPFAHEAERVRRLVDGMGQVLTELWPLIADASPEVFTAMDAARVEARRAFERETARQVHASVAARAGKAFRKGDYALAVQLLESQRDLLTPAEQEKLRLAMKYIRE